LGLLLSAGLPLRAPDRREGLSARTADCLRKTRRLTVAPATTRPYFTVNVIRYGYGLNQRMRLLSVRYSGRVPELSANHHRALVLLAGSTDGITEHMLFAHQIKRASIAELILDGLASATTVRVTAGRKPVEVRRIKITDAGRQAP
jgi:hypothetical protein